MSKLIANEATKLSSWLELADANSRLRNKPKSITGCGSLRSYSANAAAEHRHSAASAWS